MDPVVETLGKALSGLWERWEAYKSLRNEKDSLRHLLSLELRRNLALLGALRLDDGDQDGEALRAIARELETDILEQVFAPTKAAAAVRDALDAADEAVEAEADDDVAIGRTKSRLMNLYVRITAVQKLSALPRELPGLRKIQYRKRLANIESSLRDALTRADTAA